MYSGCTLHICIFMNLYAKLFCICCYCEYIGCIVVVYWLYIGAYCVYIYIYIYILCVYIVNVNVFTYCVRNMS